MKPDALSRYFNADNKEAEPDTILKPEVFVNAIEMDIGRVVNEALGTEAAPSKCPFTGWSFLPTPLSPGF